MSQNVEEKLWSPWSVVVSVQKVTAAFMRETIKKVFYFVYTFGFILLPTQCVTWLKRFESLNINNVIESVAKRSAHTIMCSYCGEQRKRSAIAFCTYCKDLMLIFHEVGLSFFCKYVSWFLWFGGHNASFSKKFFCSHSSKLSTFIAYFVF